MMKKRKLHANDVQHSEESNPVSWERNPQAQALGVYLQQGVLFVFPYSHFAFAQLLLDEDLETLRISFTTHDVCVSGHNLLELSRALQKLAVDWIREMPMRYAPLSERDFVFIERIEVKETEEPQP